MAGNAVRVLGSTEMQTLNNRRIEPAERSLRRQEQRLSPSPEHGEGFEIEQLDIEILGSGRLWRTGERAGLTDRTARLPASANVDAASVVTFVDGLSGQQKEDVLNSTLLAQLVANRKHDRERDGGGWYQTYRKVLEQVGWVSRPVRRNHSPLYGSTRRRDPAAQAPPLLPPLARPAPVLAYPFNRVAANEVRFTPEYAVLKLLNTVASDAEVMLTKTSLDALRMLPDRDRRVVIFETSSHSTAGGNFQILTVSVSSDGVIQMTIAAHFFQTDERVTRLLSFNFGQRSTQMFQASHTMTLDEAAYSAARGRVIAQLGDQAAALIEDLQI